MKTKKNARQPKQDPGQVEARKAARREASRRWREAKGAGKRRARRVTKAAGKRRARNAAEPSPSEVDAVRSSVESTTAYFRHAVERATSIASMRKEGCFLLCDALHALARTYAQHVES